MEKHRADPQGCMTVGEVAKKMGVTVRTLQYYDQKGVLSPSLASEGGRRLYTDKDVIMLHQVLSMKSLGFSLDDIKNRLPSLNTPPAVASVLSQQAETIRKRMESLAESLKAISALKEEVLDMQAVDFKKYADIVVNLRMKNEFYWLIKYFDDKTLDHIRSRFDRDSGLKAIAEFNRLIDEAIQLQEENVPPESEKGLALAKAFWDMVTKFTDGDGDMLSRLMEIGTFHGMDNEWKRRQAAANTYIEPALETYFTKCGIDPFAEEAE